MKVAIVHELLTMKGGAERVARIFADMFPEAPVYTLLYDEKKLGGWFPKERVRTSTVQPHSQFSILHSPFNHHRYLSRFPAAIESFDFSEFDLVLSSSSAFAHGIITNGKPKHLCYVHSPARYLWDRTHDVTERASRGFLGPLKRRYLEKTFHELRTWDAEVAARPDKILAASNEVQRRIQLYWDRESEVVHPPIEDVWFEETKNEKRKTKNGFIIVSTLASYKRIDLAIHACNTLNLPLKIVGSGPAESALKRIAGPTIAFLGYREHAELKDLYAEAKALIIPGEEDFGLVALEAEASGTPVIAYGKGGVRETVIEGTTGRFFEEPTSAALQPLLASFDATTLNPEDCRKQAENFRRSQFEHKIRTNIESLMS